MTRQVKWAFKHRFYPTHEQAAEPSRTFGCVRLVYNKALEERRRDRARLAKAQRELSRKVKGSANPAKASRKVARMHARIADRRRDFLHKLSTRLVRENQTVVIEDLLVRNMVNNHALARAISDAAWREFRSMLEYQTDWYGRELLVIDRWLPSSKLCGACGTVTAAMPSGVREWTCECGAVHDRDINAAKNILAAGLVASACGDGVRPQREPSRTGQSSVKQETQRVTAGIPAFRRGEEVNTPAFRHHGGPDVRESGPPALQ